LTVAWFITWLFGRLGVPTEEIGRGDDNLPYMVRWTLFGRRRGARYRVFLHRFLRSDLDTLHDHPWSFVSIILAGGYHERTADDRRRWYGPGRILRRAADWQHRVEIAPGRECWSLVITGPKVRTWGFWCPGGFLPWAKADANLRARGHVCESAE
jgi:hypothetical protein